MLNKKFAASLVIGLILTGCSASVPQAAEAQSKQIIRTPIAPQVSTNLIELIKARQEEYLAIEEKKALAKAFQENRTIIQKRLVELKAYVGKTRYVFSGSTPRGWDCSGLTKWFYSGIGIELEHSATKQATFGSRVDEPRIGDLVAFKHFNAKRYYHIGIYIGNNKIIHSREPGTVTAIAEISDSWFDRSHVHFIRIVGS